MFCRIFCVKILSNSISSPYTLHITSIFLAKKLDITQMFYILVMHFDLADT
jgi:hypothetical protein